MRIVYICSPYRAADEETLHRNIEYARELTREALLRGESLVVPFHTERLCPQRRVHDNPTRYTEDRKSVV